MKRLLILLLLAIPSSFANTIPEITDFKPNEFEKEFTVDFWCPRETSWERDKKSGKRKKVVNKLYSDCWATFYKDRIDIMGTQIINREQILYAWPAYHYFHGPVCPAQFWQWNIAYKNGDNKNIFTFKMFNRCDNNEKISKNKDITKISLKDKWICP